MKLTLALIIGLYALQISVKAQTQEESQIENQRIGHLRMFDSYGNIPFSDEKARLDNLAIYLQKDEPTLIVYIMVYAGKRACAGEAQARAVRAKNYLVRKRGIEFNRIIWKDAGYREELTVELHPRLRNFDEPYASPTITPNEVQIVKCHPQSRIRKRRGRM